MSRRLFPVRPLVLFLCITLLMSFPYPFASKVEAATDVQNLIFDIDDGNIVVAQGTTGLKVNYGNNSLDNIPFTSTITITGESDDNTVLVNASGLKGDSSKIRLKIENLKLDQTLGTAVPFAVTGGDHNGVRYLDIIFTGFNSFKGSPGNPGIKFDGTLNRIKMTGVTTSSITAASIYSQGGELLTSSYTAASGFEVSSYNSVDIEDGRIETVGCDGITANNSSGTGYSGGPLTTRGDCTFIARAGHGYGSNVGIYCSTISIYDYAKVQGIGDYSDIAGREGGAGIYANSGITVIDHGVLTGIGGHSGGFGNSTAATGGDGIFVGSNSRFIVRDQAEVYGTGGDGGASGFSQAWGRGGDGIEVSGNEITGGLIEGRGGSTTNTSYMGGSGFRSGTNSIIVGGTINGYGGNGGNTLDYYQGGAGVYFPALNITGNAKINGYGGIGLSSRGGSGVFTAVYYLESSVSGAAKINAVGGAGQNGARGGSGIHTYTSLTVSGDATVNAAGGNATTGDGGFGLYSQTKGIDFNPSGESGPISVINGGNSASGVRGYAAYVENTADYTTGIKSGNINARHGTGNLQGVGSNPVFNTQPRNASWRYSGSVVSPLTVTVTDNTGIPVKNAKLSIASLNYYAVTDDSGEAYLWIPAGTYDVKCEKLGYTATISSKQVNADVSISYTNAMSITLPRTKTILTVDPSINDKYYDGAAAAISTSFRDGGTLIPNITAEYTYTGVGETSYGPTSVAPVNAGYYRVVVKVPDSNNSYAGISEPVFFKINKAPLSIASITSVPRTYGDTDQVTATGIVFNGIVQGETFIRGVDYQFDSLYANSQDAGIQRLSGSVRFLGAKYLNYDVNMYLALPETASIYIAPAVLTITDAHVFNKEYDGSDRAAVSPVTFSGLKGSDRLYIYDYSVDARFDSKNAGNNKAVTGTVTLLNTSNSKNYTLGNNNLPSGTRGNITKSNNLNTQDYWTDVINGMSFTYSVDLDTIISGLLTQNDIGNVAYTLGAITSGSAFVSKPAIKSDGHTIEYRTANFNEYNVVAKQEIIVTTENYRDVSFTIHFVASDKQNATIENVSVPNKVYDGLSVSAIGSPVVSAGGFIVTESPIYTYSGTGDTSYGPTSVAPKNAGSYRLVLSIPQASQYSGNSDAINFTISKAALTVQTVTPANKPYDGNTGVTISSIEFSGLKNNETLAKTTDYTVSGQFASKEAGDGISVTGSIALSSAGSTAKNYTVSSGSFPAGTRANISKAPLSIGSATVQGKIYDGTTDATVLNIGFIGLKNGETLQKDSDYEISAQFASANAGSNISIGGIVTLKDSSAAKNYSLTSQQLPSSLKASISKASGLMASSLSAIPVKSESEITYTFDLNSIGLSKEDLGGKLYQLSTPSDQSGILKDQPELTSDNHTIRFTVKDSATAGQTATIPVYITTNNYTDILVNLTVQVSERTPVTITGAAVTNKIYDGNPASVFSDPVFYISGTNTTVSGINLDYYYESMVTGYSSENAPKDAGNYTLTVSVPAGNTEYIGNLVISFSIAKKEVIVKAENKTIYTGDPFPTYTYQATGFVGQDALLTLPQYDCSALGTGSTGEFIITPGGATAGDNYYLTYQSGILTIKEKSIINPFTDVKASDWFYDNVMYVVQNGLFTGTSATKFSPGMNMNRGMLVTVLGRLEGIDQDAYKGSSFPDVPLTAYYAPYVLWAKGEGIVLGITEKSFQPLGNVTREQVAAILYRYADFKAYTLPEINPAQNFVDSSKISAYAKDAVAAMQKAGIINGKNGNKFDPKGYATRAEVAAMLHRFAEVVQ